MRRYTLAAAMLALLLMSAFSTTLHAQTTNWVSVSSITDTTGNVAVANGSPLLAGHSYNLSLTVNVPFTQNSSTFTVSLWGAFVTSGPQFWYINTPSYPGYSPANLNGLKSITFTQVQGSLSMTALFTIPVNFTEATVETLTFRFIQTDVPVVSVQVSGGSTVGTAAFNVSDDAIQTYLTTYSQKLELIPSGQVASTYTTLVNDVLAQSQAIYAAGNPIQATALLNTLTPETLPAPPNTSITIVLIAALAVVLVLAALFFVMLLRSRAGHGFAKGTMGEVQKELASLEITAAKYDKSLADRLRNLKDKLGEAI